MTKEIWLVLVICVTVAALVAIVVTYLILARRHAAAMARAEAELQHLQQRLESGDSEAKAWQARLVDGAAQVEKLNEELRSESIARASAEAKVGMLSEAEQQVAVLRDENGALKNRMASTEARMVEEKKAMEEKLALLADAGRKFSDEFARLASESLRKNNVDFLALAQSALGKYQTEAASELEKKRQSIHDQMKPIGEILHKFEGQLQELETKRASAYTDLERYLKTVGETQDKLRAETGNLVRALSAPKVRGMWGEMQLRRLVELSGMQKNCDFEEQLHVKAEGGALRPDMVIRMPGGKSIPVDAKTPLSAYLEAAELQDDEAKTAKLQEHAKQVWTQVQLLSKKQYWDQFENSPDVVVLFIPGDHFLSAALEHQPNMLEDAMRQSVLIATPVTLMALLRAVAFGWQQQAISDNAQRVFDLGIEVHERLAVFMEYIHELGGSITKSVQHYNQAVRSYESRLSVSLNKFQELQCVSAKSLPVLNEVETAVIPSTNRQRLNTNPDVIN